MKKLSFTAAVNSAIIDKMKKEKDIVLIGEDIRLIRREITVKFGPDRILAAPISESAFLGAAVTASMSGLRPVVEFYMADFLPVALDAIINHAAKLRDFSGGGWYAPIVIRIPCGGGLGDGGQHEQTLWGMISHIPGLNVVVPSNPRDAGSLMYSSLESDDPVLFFEHKLLSDDWVEFLGSGGRKSVEFDIPEEGRYGEVPRKWEALPFGEAKVYGDGSDLTIVTAGVMVHRALKVKKLLEKDKLNCSVIDLRTLVPLDKLTLINAVSISKKLLVVDEDYKTFGLSGEICAILAEAGVKFNFRRVCTDTTIPYSRKLELKVIPDCERIYKSALELLGR